MDLITAFILTTHVLMRRVLRVTMIIITADFKMAASWSPFPGLNQIASEMEAVKNDIDLQVSFGSTCLGIRCDFNFELCPVFEAT